MTDIKYFILTMLYNSEDRTIDRNSILNSKIATPNEIQENIFDLSSAPTAFIKNITCSDKYTLTNEGVYAFESEKERRCQISKDEKTQKSNNRINRGTLLVALLSFIFGTLIDNIVKLISLIMTSSG